MDVVRMLLKGLQLHNAFIIKYYKTETENREQRERKKKTVNKCGQFPDSSCTKTNKKNKIIPTTRRRTTTLDASSINSRIASQVCNWAWN